MSEIYTYIFDGICTRITYFSAMYSSSNTFYKLYRFYRSYTLTQRLVSRPGYGGGGSELNEFIASKCDCSEDGE